VQTAVRAGVAVVLRDMVNSRKHRGAEPLCFFLLTREKIWFGKSARVGDAAMTDIPAEPVWGIVAGLVIIALMVLILPFKVKFIEHNLEMFFLIMGILSATRPYPGSGVVNSSLTLLKPR
jgi:hypothetical protein